MAALRARLRWISHAGPPYPTACGPEVLFPIVGVVLGVSLLGESANWRLVGGLLMVLGGMSLVNVRSRQPAVSAQDVAAASPAPAKPSAG